MSVWLRTLTWCLALGMIVLPLAAVMHGWLAPQRWPIRHLLVTAEYQHVGEDSIRATVQQHLGNGYFDSDPAAIRAALVDLPWVAEVQVRKRWPDRIEVQLREHHAVAQWGDGHMLSDAGVVFPALASVGDQDLPRLSGPDARATEVFGFYQQSQALFAGVGLAVRGARLSRRGSWSLQLADGATVVIGREADPQLRLRRWVKAMPAVMAGQTRALARVDLRYTNGFAVRWADAVTKPDAPSHSDAAAAVQAVRHAPSLPVLADACRHVCNIILTGFKA
ncbi:MAG TPA: cell division protein FtsQ/DivIB [Chiayiivirga sp.]|nr:cell division protein FtsQ/DivIB [Chiayiivirga sp.]